jgi:hypothetical protein
MLNVKISPCSAAQETDKVKFLWHFLQNCNSGSPPGAAPAMKDEPDVMYTPNYWTHPSTLGPSTSFLESSTFDAVWNGCNGMPAGSYFTPPVTSSPPGANVIKNTMVILTILVLGFKCWGKLPRYLCLPLWAKHWAHVPILYKKNTAVNYQGNFNPSNSRV